MTRERLDLGKLGEELAFKKIKRIGYKCLARNYRCPLGEVDLIAKDGDTLVFIEIKTRKGKSIGYAKEAVDARKRRQLSKVALTYIKANDCWHMRSRFDVVAINFNNNKREIEIIKDAFEIKYSLPSFFKTLNI